MAAVPQGSSFIWPSFTVITTSRSIWRGESHKSEQVADTRGRSWLPRFGLILTIHLGCSSVHWTDSGLMFSLLGNFLLC